MIVFIHAFPLSSVMWEPLTAELGIPSRSINLPGFGGRSLPPGPPTLATFADDVFSQIADLDEVILVGCSLGGYVIMEMLRQERREIAAVALMDTKHTADAPAAQENRERVAALAEREGIAELVDQLSEPLLGSKSQWLLPAVQALVRATAPKTIAWTQRAMAARPDSASVLRAFAGPALVVVGEEDGLAPVAGAREMADLLPRHQFAVIPEVGHLAPWESPTAVAQAIQRWLNSFQLGE